MLPDRRRTSRPPHRRAQVRDSFVGFGALLVCETVPCPAGLACWDEQTSRQLREHGSWPCLALALLNVFCAPPVWLTTPPLSTMLVESIICRPTSSYPYHIAAKRYFMHSDGEPVEQPYDEHDEDLTLVFLHSTGFPKEMWEPTIEDLLAGCNRSGTKIREAYAIDCPNHGEAAVLNDGLLGDYEGMMKSSSVSAATLRTSLAGTKLFAECATQFLLSGPTFHTPVDFSKRNLVGIGHSVGGVSV